MTLSRNKTIDVLSMFMPYCQTYDPARERSFDYASDRL